MIYYILGILSGILLSTFILIVIAYFRPKIERTINRTVSILNTKGKILEPENEDLDNWVETLETK